MSPPDCTAGGSRHQVGERMGDPGVEGQSRRPADDTDDTEVSGVGLIEDRCPVNRSMTRALDVISSTSFSKR